MAIEMKNQGLHFQRGMREDWVFCNWETLSGKRGAELEEEVKLGTPDDLFKDLYCARCPG